MKPMKEFEIVKGTLLEYWGPGGNVVIPEGVTTIGDHAFYECGRLNNSEKNVLTPNSLTSIGKSAFLNTAMWKEPQGGAVYAGNWIVGYNASVGQVASVDVKSADIVGIADYAFANCKTLTSFILPDGSNLRYIGKGAFYPLFFQKINNAVIGCRFEKGEVAPLAEVKFQRYLLFKGDIFLFDNCFKKFSSES